MHLPLLSQVIVGISSQNELEAHTAGDSVHLI